MSDRMDLLERYECPHGCGSATPIFGQPHDEHCGCPPRVKVQYVRVTDHPRGVVSAERDRMRVALGEIATTPVASSDPVAMGEMRALAREALDPHPPRGVVSTDARTWTLEVCSHCGALAGSSAHGHADAPDWRWEQVAVVPMQDPRPPAR